MCVTNQFLHEPFPNCAAPGDISTFAPFIICVTQANDTNIALSSYDDTGH